MTTLATPKAKVQNMTSSRGNVVPNQFIIKTDEGTFFQSYQSIVAFKSKSGEIVLDEHTWNYSRTTAKYRNDFLGEGVVETRQKIESGEYTLANLNG